MSEKLDLLQFQISGLMGSLSSLVISTGGPKDTTYTLLHLSLQWNVLEVHPHYV